MKKNLRNTVAIVLSLIMVISIGSTAFAADFKYTHDPMKDDRAKSDIVVNSKAVYGYSPNPESERLGEFAKYDWSDESLVASSKKDREDYHERVESELLTLLEKGKKKGNSVEKIARTLSRRRNEIRLEEAEEDDKLAETKKSNLEKYGDENGPTPESLYEKYGSWEMVAAKAFSVNVGMDVCLGLYDKYYDTYGVMDNLFAKDANTLSVKKKVLDVNAEKLCGSDVKVGIKAKNAVGKVSFKAADAASKQALSVDAKGQVTVKKCTPAGTYKIKVTAKGNDYYKKKSVMVKIRVK
ncbi:MAG: hypothetical protein K6B14_11885 [Lachnospiraceae bacterium]|nr:hypothetical protein [Lachnospiraceae bacterium]